MKQELKEKSFELSGGQISRDFDFSPLIYRNLISNLGELMNTAKDALSANFQKRLAWRDSFIERENDLVELINLPYLGDKEKDLLSNTLIKYSKSLLELVSKDLENIHPRSDNMVLDIIYSFANSSELQAKKTFWLDIIENQNKVLMEVVKSGTNPEINSVACELLVSNCDILISGLKREIEEQPMVFTAKRLQNAKETRNNAKKGKVENHKENKEEQILTRDKREKNKVCLET